MFHRAWSTSLSKTLLGAGLLAALASALAVSCHGGNDDPAQSSCDGSWSSVYTLFQHSCSSTGCHGSTETAAGLDLTFSDPAVDLVNVPSGTCNGWTRVVPGDPEQSLLWRKLYSETAPCGEPMPLGTHLDAVSLGCVRSWILSLPATEPANDGGCQTCGGSACIDLQTDPANCGACGNACSPGAGCAAGQCQCGGQLVDCSGACVDTGSNASNCGGCGQACPTGALCSVGQCLCSGSLTACGTTCVDTSSDPAHCGGCNQPCSAGQFCLLGKCSTDCGSLTACGASCVDTQTSAFNCGGCGRACPTGASCVSGTCQCPAGTDACNGVCIDIYADPANCGGCGVTCSSPAVCESGKCQCPGGGTQCGTVCVDTSSDSHNCGVCGNICSIGQTCTSGACVCTTTSGVSFANNVQPIFTQSCALAGCHSSLRPQEGMNLSAGAAYANLVGVAARECTGGRLRVKAGDPATSYVMDKLMGVDLCFGTQMPKTGVSLPQSQIETIAAWICEGAPQN